MDKIATLRALLSSIEIHMLHYESHERIAFVPVRGAAEPVAIFEQAELVCWVRLVGDTAIFRYGSMRTNLVSQPQALGDPWRDGVRDAIAEAVNQAWDEINPARPPAGSSAGEPERFVASVEAGEMILPPPAALAAAPRAAAQAVAATQVPAASDESPYAVEFNAFRHDSVRYPAAPGYSEQQLEGRILETVHPAAVPAVIGAVVMFMAVLPMPYEFYVLLRWAVPAMAIWMCIVAGGQKKRGWVTIFVLVAVLWNPILPIEMPRSAWVFFNVAGLAVFARAGTQLMASKPALRPDYPGSV